MNMASQNMAVGLATAPLGGVPIAMVRVISVVPSVVAAGSNNKRSSLAIHDPPLQWLDNEQWHHKGLTRNGVKAAPEPVLLLFKRQ